MSDSASDDENTHLIEIKFKTIQETYNVKVNENATIKQLKKTMAKKLNQPEEKICLIFSGKILKDHENLSQHHIGDGMVLHMVIRNQPSTSTASAATTPSVSTAPTGGAAPNLAGTPPSLGGIGDLFNNPELVQGILNSPFMESMLANPDIIRTMLSQNPQFQQIIQNNPELGHIMNDPGTMRQAMEMIRNPTALNELMRNHDQAIRNLQGIPGGEAALQRLYERVQEPLMNLTQPGADNVTGSGAQNTTDDSMAASRSQHAGVENAQPLPNPWSSIVNQQNRQAAGSAGNAPAQGAAPAGLPFANMMNTPGMQSLFRQISSNQSAMQQLMSQDNMRNFTQMIGSNPAFFQQLMQSFPGFNSPEIVEQIRNNMPQLTSLMTNPQMLQVMSNPRVVAALQQIQQASQVLRQEAPQLFTNFPGADMFQNLGGMAGLFGGMANAASQAQPPTSAGATEAGTQPSAPPGQNIPSGFAELLGSLMNLSTTVNSSQPPEERFRAQLEQLTAMGFTDQQANIQALLASFGDLSGAIERLLGGGGQGNADTF
ncbi:hypothetical protein niasHS_012401 [Heterodera schachtii]|uniref:Ubiquilin-1 n=1 Tax=Heterodera schachtii TaxID=97005 RepID=A0ABD2IMA2_HETSC